MNRFLMITLAFFSILLPSSATIVQDEFVSELLNVEKPYVNNNYNYESVIRVPIKLKVRQEIKSENNLLEGQIVRFYVAKDVYYNHHKLIEAETPAEAKVGIIITTGMNGIPASIIFTDFHIRGIKTSRIDSCYEKFGQDRSWFVFPLKWLLTPLPPTGSFTNFIKGGHAKFKMKDEIVIFYHPEWN